MSGAASGAARPSPVAYALELQRLTKRFGNTEIIRGVDLAIGAGERVAVIGPNGAGKSTLFNLISGRLVPSGGEIRLHGERIDGANPFEVNRKGLARSFQVSNIFPRLSTFENLRCASLWATGMGYSFWRSLSGAREANERAHDLVGKLGLGHVRHTAAMHLTYAEQRALEIGITVAGGADVILLDEPTAGMSKTETSRFVQLIKDMTEHKTLVTVEHDMGVVFGLADKIAVLVYGQVIAFDVPEAVRANQEVQEAYLGSVIAEAQAQEAGR